MKVAVLQSNYLPWKGYFDIIHDVDLFVFYDDVQYTKNDWRNRNKIKTANGPLWLTVPVGQSLNRLTCEVTIDDTRWAEKHFRTLCQYYGKAPYFARYLSFLEGVYLGQRWTTLVELNHYLIKTIAREFLGITTTFADSRDYPAQGSKLDRLLDLLRHFNTQYYLSGPAARGYIIPEKFANAGIELVFKDYSDYPEYPQFHPPFDHAVTILDLLFHAGPDAPRYIWECRERKGGS